MSTRDYLRFLVQSLSSSMRYYDGHMNVRQYRTGPLLLKGFDSKLAIRQYLDRASNPSSKRTGKFVIHNIVIFPGDTECII